MSGDVIPHTHCNHPVHVIMKVDLYRKLVVIGDTLRQGVCVCTVYCTPSGDHVTHCPRGIGNLT